MPVINKLIESWNQIIKTFADGGYRGQLIDKVKAKFKIEVEIIKRDELHALKYHPNAGSWKELFLGLTSIDVTQRIMNDLTTPVSQWCIYLL